MTATMLARPLLPGQQLCPDCHGTGELPDQRREVCGCCGLRVPCWRCAGFGTIPTSLPLRRARSVR